MLRKGKWPTKKGARKKLSLVEVPFLRKSRGAGHSGIFLGVWRV